MRWPGVRRRLSHYYHSTLGRSRRCLAGATIAVAISAGMFPVNCVAYAHFSWPGLVKGNNSSAELGSMQPSPSEHASVFRPSPDIYGCLPRADGFDKRGCNIKPLSDASLLWAYQKFCCPCWTPVRDHIWKVEIWRQVRSEYIPTNIVRRFLVGVFPPFSQTGDTRIKRILFRPSDRGSILKPLR